MLGVAAVLVLFTVPGWPMFKMHELKWLKSDKLEDYVKEQGKKEKK